MALHRGIQSAIFYYLSCAPLSNARYRKKRKAEAKRHRAAHDALAEEFPDFYRQPCPSMTNPWWQSEIEAGPSINPRRKRMAATTDVGWKGRPSGDTSRATSSVTLAPGTDPTTTGTSQARTAQFQREDEQLWGSKWDKDTVRRPPQARMRDPSATSAQYQNYRNPSVNEMHPPIAPSARTRDDILWMMQPPPVAEVMNGKERPSTNASNRANDHLSPYSQPMTRTGSSNASERGSRVGKKAPASVASTKSGHSAHAGAGQAHDRNPTTSERDFANEPQERPHRMRNNPAQQSEDSSATVIHKPDLAAEPPKVAPVSRAALRPQLSTIMSDNIVASKDGREATSETLQAPSAPKENSIPTARGNEASTDLKHIRSTSRSPKPFTQGSAKNVNEHPLRIMQDLSPGSAAVFNTKLISPASPITESSVIRIPARNGDKSGGYGSGDDLSIRPDMIDGWIVRESDLPNWIHEHTKREVRQRWSMDI